jgi:HEPN superfamily Swt1-like protein
MSAVDGLYAFVFKGAVAQDTADRTLARLSPNPDDSAERIAEKMPFSLLDGSDVEAARKMSHIYTAIAAFENSARKFIQDRLLEEVGADWWDQVPAPVRTSAEKRKKDEEQARWHGARGTSLIFYTQLGDLVKIMRGQIEHFEDHIQSIDWAQQIFRALERSRNVIMHGGELAMNDIERVAMNIKDWLNQVGG